MSDFQPIFEPVNKGPRLKGPNKALVIFAHGKGLVLCWSADEGLTEFIEGAGGHDFHLEDCGAHYDPPEGTAIMIATIEVVDDGPGDWPGTREVCLQLTDMRPATAEEWRAHLDGEWPWEVER